jgi:hypothetical protein
MGRSLEHDPIYLNDRPDKFQPKLTTTLVDVSFILPTALSKISHNNISHYFTYRYLRQACGLAVR